MNLNPWNLLLSLIGGILAFFYQIIPNYGIAIILLTLAISLVLFPMTLKQTRSMKAMQEIQPEVKRLQKELKGDREELNKRLMELYQERGVNPAAGCLPLVIQMPIWFALFSVLRGGSGIPADSALAAAVDPAREAINAGVSLADPVFDAVRFLGMNLMASPSRAVSEQGLIAAIPYLILVLVIVAAGYYQQVQTTRTRDDKGQQSQAAQSMQSAMKIMPVFFGFISWTLPAGLGLYFATSNIFRIGQQALILRMDEEDGNGKETAGSSGSDQGDDRGSSGNGPRNGPSRNASKKRNRRKRR